MTGAQGAFFDMAEPAVRAKPPGRRWGGADSRAARAIVRPMLPAPCTKCGKPVTEDMDWHADHIHAAALGGANDASNYGPAHARCNEADGGKLGAMLTNGFKAENITHRERTVKWW